jgi:TDG/mug DNA glycosylase family protein
MSSDHRTTTSVDLTALPVPQWPRQLAVAYASLLPGAELVIRHHAHERFGDLVVGAGFEVIESRRSGARARRLRTLPDTVGPRMRVLVCGLNPSIYAADAGVGFARPGNRFWPAAIEAGLATRDRDPFHALDEHGLGMTDLVKRATRAARELTGDEYRAGFARVARLVTWFRPGAVCFVGLSGYRQAVDRAADAGPQAEGIDGVAVYVMPSTSGANAATSRATLVGHLRSAAALADTTLT